MFSRMKEEGYAPNVQAYNALLSVCARRGDITACELVFDEMTDKRTIKFTPDVASHALMLFCYAYAIPDTPKEERLELIKKAEACFREMLDPEKKFDITSQTLNIMLRLYSNADLSETAEAFLAKYPEYGVQPDEFSYRLMIKMWNRLLDPEKAQEAFMTMRNQGITPDYISYLLLIKGCVIAKYYKRAIKYMKEMRILGMFPKIDDMAHFRYKIKKYYPEMWEEVGRLCDHTRDTERIYYAPKVYDRDKQ